MSTGGLLIVNADDWGLDAETTDAIAACFESGRVTSATAMVFMADSERAAALAQRIALPVGLHLNLSEAFTGAAVPEPIRTLQAELVPRFTDRGRRWRRWLPDPRIANAVERAVADQLEGFRELYGRDPTHVDGHKHVHISPTVACTPSLAHLPLRRAISDAPGSRSPVAAARRIRHRLILSRMPGTDHFVAISSLRQELVSGPAPGQLSSLARSEIVEVMAHPGLPDEQELLMTDAWARVMSDARLGSYEDLA